MRKTLFLCVSILCLFAVCGCSSWRTVKDEAVAVTVIKDSTRWIIKDSIRITDQIRTVDSIILHDSVVITMENGEVKEKEFFRIRDRFRDTASERDTYRENADSLTASRVDSIYIDRVVVKEKKPTLKDRIESAAGYALALALFVILAYTWIKRFKSR